MRYRLAWTALFLTAVIFAAELPLSVSAPTTGPKSHVVITNQSDRVVTGWALAATSEADGGRIHREVYTADAYLSEATHDLPGASPTLNRLLPHESRELPLDPLPQGAKVEVVAVVLDDGTAIGDETVIGSIFSRRQKERDALGAVVRTFTDVLTATKGDAALDALRARFMALVEQDDAIPCKAALDAVLTFGRTSRPEQIDQSLHTYAAFVAREYELALRHATRKRS